MIVLSRPNRSATAPPTGASTAAGRLENSMARPISAADPVACMIHNSMATSKTRLPSVVTNWPCARRKRFLNDDVCFTALPRSE